MINEKYVLVGELNKNIIAINDAMIYLSVGLVVVALGVGFLFIELKKIKTELNKNKNG